MEETLKILVVDDDEVDRMAVYRALKLAGLPLELSEAEDCAGAIATLKNQSFDCVFLDYLLPDGDGLSLVQAARASGIKAPIIVLTGQGDEQIAVELMKAGASDYLSKGKVSSENLAKILRNAVRIHHAEMEAALANQRRQESEERYRFVLEGSNDGIWDWLIAKNEVYCNDRLWEIIGLSPEEFKGTYEAFCALIHPDDRAIVIDAVEAHLTRQVEFNVEVRLCHVSGEHRYCIARAKAQRDRFGVPFRMSGTITDLTERKLAEEALRFLAQASAILSASLDYQTTLKNLANLVVPHLADWCAVDLIQPNQTCSRVAVAYYDVTEPEWTAQKTLNYPIPTHSSAGAPKVLQTGISELYPELPPEFVPAIAHGEEHLKRLQASTSLSAMCVPIQIHQQTLGTITFVSATPHRRYQQASLSLAEDLGRRAALAIDNARLYREAQEANRMKDEFLANLSHELRTPLNAMHGWAQMLKSRKLDAQKTAHAIETIERNARSQTQMIEDLLDVSRIIRGQLRLNITQIELVPIIEAALDTVRPAADAKGITLAANLNRGAGLVSGDATRLQQVIWNLLSNGVKFTPSSGQVEINLQRVDSWVQIQVKDTGIGISSEFLPYVFDRFRQADGTSTKAYGGLGLGLAIVRHLVELHGGTVEADSPGEGQGASFIVKLPVQQMIAAETLSAIAAQPVPQKLTVAPPETSLSGLHVLVVDDDADTREVFSVMLNQYGAEVTTVASGMEALAQMEQLQPDVLVSDIAMPDLDGYALIRRVRELEAQRGGYVSALALTAYARPSDRQAALDAGFEMHLSKPIEPAQLIQAIAQIKGRTSLVD